MQIKKGDIFLLESYEGKDYPTRLRYTKVNHHNTKLGKILYK